MTVKTAVMYMTVKKIADDRTEGFLYFKKNAAGAGFVNTCMAMITELIHSGITPEILSGLADKALREKKAFADKLIDISRIYTSYEQTLTQSGLRDSSKDTLLAAQKAYSSGFFSGENIYIDEFKSFTGDQYSLIRAMIRNADSVSVCITTKDIHDRNIFLSLNRTVSVLSSISSEEIHQNAEINAFDNAVRYRSPALAHLSENLGSIRPEGFNEETDAVRIISSPDIYTECAYICSEIKRLITDEGYYCKDIAVLSRQMDNDINILGSYMELYGLPFYSDKKHSASHKSLVCLINCALSCITGHITTENILCIAKTGFIVSENEASDLENYAYRWDIEGNMWERQFPDDDMELLRRKLLDPLSVFRKKQDIPSAVREFLEITGIYEQLDKDKESLSEAENSRLHTENNWVKEQTENILASLDEVCRICSPSPSDIAQIFVMASEKMELSTPPSSLNEVVCQQSDLARLSSPKVVFVMHAVDGVFPDTPSDSRTFSETERMFFKGEEHDLSGDIRLLTSEERFNAYKAMCAASDRLYLSYSVSDKSEPSLFVRKTEKIFTSDDNRLLCSRTMLDKMTYDEVFDILSLTPASAYAYTTEHRMTESKAFTVSETLSEDEMYRKRFDVIEKARDNSLQTHRLTSGMADRLFGEKLHVSPTSAERYAVCPFKFFCANGLGIRKPEKQRLDNAKWGLIVHECLEKLMRPHEGETPLQSKQRFIGMTKENMRNDIERYIREYTDKNFAEQFRSKDMDTYLKRLSSQTLAFAWHMRDEMAVSEFIPKAFEVKIRHEEESPHTVCFNGTVDRIDEFVSENGDKYIRVIDYKTGYKKFSLDDVANGINIQMLLYMFEASEIPEFNGSRYAGVLYALVHAPKSIESRDPTSEDIIQNLNDTLRMDGIILKDENNMIITAMEPAIKTAIESMTDHKGRFIPVNVKAYKSGIKLDEKQLGDADMFEGIKDMIYSQLEQMCKDIYDGIIPASPLESGDSRHTSCEFCDFSDLCMNRNITERKRSKFGKEENDG